LEDDVLVDDDARVRVGQSDLTSDHKIVCPMCGRANPREANGCMNCGVGFRWSPNKS